jgi:putative transposase
MLCARKTELKPNNVQKTLFAKAAGCARFAYNWDLALRKKEYAETGKSGNAIDHHKTLNRLKQDDFPWMYEVSKCAPQEAMRDLDIAMKNFFDGIKAGSRVGFPRFKSKHRDKPKFRFSSRCAVSAGKIKLPRIGWVRLKEKSFLPMAGDPAARQLFVSVKGTGSGRWFVSVQYEVDAPDFAPGQTLLPQAEMDKLSPATPALVVNTLKESDKVLVPVTRTVGIDRGLIDFAVTSDGEKFRHPKYLRKAERRLRRLQRCVSRRKKGGWNRHKAIKWVSRQHFKVACKRRDFINKLTTHLVKTKLDAKFVIESLGVKGMIKNHKLAKSIGDSGWGEFERELKYKLDWAHLLIGTPLAGSRIAKADRWFPSSRMCCRCHTIKRDLGLGDRVFMCLSPACGNVMDRDDNAAINLANYEAIVASGVWTPKAEKVSEELPLVRREVTPGERKGRKQPRGTRKETPSKLSSGLGRGING